MATDSEAATQAFPNPPTILYECYTDEAIENGTAPKPPPPIQGHYQMFGVPFNTQDAMIRSLEEQNIDRLYPQQYDKKAELKKINRSILICFLELLDILIDNPSSNERNTKIKDLNVLFINMHHLINEYRPHQARETLRVIMERQKKQREEMILQITRVMEKARGILRSCDSGLRQLVSSLAATTATLDEEQDIMDTSDNNKALNQDNQSNDHPLIDTQDKALIDLVNEFLISSSIPK